MTLAHKFREWLASLLPPGYNRSEEKRTFYGTIMVVLFYSIRNFSVNYRDAYRLLCDPEILDRQVLLPGAIMEDFVRVLGTNLQMYQWMAAALLAVQLWSRYRYFKQGARADYTLRRLPQRHARFRYCWSLPLLEAAVILLLIQVGGLGFMAFATLIMVALGSLSALGYGPLAGVTVFGMQFLDFFDFLTNSVMMPIAAIATCLLVSRVIGVQKIEEEVTLSGKPFRRKKIFNFMIQYLCPVFAAIILVSSVANALGWIAM